MNKSSDMYKMAEALGGVPLMGCVPGSPSHRAGMRYGDIILACNGVPTPDIDAYFEGRKLREDGMTVRWWRDGSEHESELLYAGTVTREDMVEWVEGEGGLGYMLPSSSDEGGDASCN